MDADNNDIEEYPRAEPWQLGACVVRDASRTCVVRVKLLVLAHIPPPLHGQSVMVQTLLNGLRGRPDFRLRHVNFQLSSDNADIGRWRSAKILRAAALSCHAIAARLRHGCDTLYYVPAPPGKRGALYRDWLVMALCRPFFRRLVLHWHAVGLGTWLVNRATGFEQRVTRALLGRAELSIVLADSLRDDAVFLGAQRITVVPNGVADPGPAPTRKTAPLSFQALFLGLCSEEKGLFAAAEAVVAANQSSTTKRFTLVAAGPFLHETAAARFRTLAAAHPAIIRHVGFADEAQKKLLFAASDCLIFPTHYAAEGLPLVVLEALAHDLPVIATRWRALPEVVPPSCGQLVPPHDGAALAAALVTLSAAPPNAGACREYFLRHFTLDRHLTALAAALGEMESPIATVRSEKPS